MTYVDALRPCLPSRRWPYAASCHLVSDSVAELHDFAARLGLKRKWFQDGTHPHYDLTRNKRLEACVAGARQIDAKGLVEVMRAWRKAGKP